MALKRPILVGGLGLSATLWLLGTVHIGWFDSSTLLSAMALGSGIWWWRRQDRPPALARPIAPPVVDRPRVEAQLADLKTLIDTLATEAALVPASDLEALSLTVTPYEQQRQHLLSELDRQRIQIAVVGDRHTGKTTLINLLTARPEAAMAPLSLAFSEIALSSDGPTEADWHGPDALLFVTDGDITDSALALLKQRTLTGQGGILVFNKTDYYDPADQQIILTQLQQQAVTLPAPVTVVPVAAAPRPTKVRRHQADGTVEEWWEEVAPAIASLEAAIIETLVAQAPTLVAATTLRQGEVLRQQVQTALNQVRRQRAMPLIDQLQWVAAAAAFANPVPTLDVLATVAINGQLIMDLGKIYGLNLSLDEAKTAASTLASLTVKLGLVELSSQALTALLKSHFATYLAGGTVQGLSAAYLTRMAGLSLIDYFEQAALAGTPVQAISWATIAQRLQTVIQPNRQVTLLQTLIKQGLSILKPTEVPVLPTAATPVALGLSTPTPDLVTLDPVTPEPVILDTDSIPA